MTVRLTEEEGPTRVHVFCSLPIVPKVPVNAAMPATLTLGIPSQPVPDIEVRDAQRATLYYQEGRVEVLSVVVVAGWGKGMAMHEMGGLKLECLREEDNKVS